MNSFNLLRKFKALLQKMVNDISGTKSQSHQNVSDDKIFVFEPGLEPFDLNNVVSILRLAYFAVNEIIQYLGSAISIAEEGMVLTDTAIIPFKANNL